MHIFFSHKTDLKWRSTYSSELEEFVLFEKILSQVHKDRLDKTMRSTTIFKKQM